LTTHSNTSARPCEGVLGAIGGTPLIGLRRYAERRDIELWAKLEAANPAGSSKDRSAARLVFDAIERGEIGPGTTVIESTSGNLGVGLAQVCRYLGLPLICVVDSRTHELNLGTMRAFGAEVRVVDREQAAGKDLLAARLELVRELIAMIDGAYWPNQYENDSSQAAHANGTMREIDEALDGRLDYLFVATSTTGTLRGCCDYLDRECRDTRVVAVDAVGSVLFGGERSERRLPGFGAGVTTGLSKGAWFDRLVRVDELACVIGCRRLVDREALFVGASSGAVASTFDSLADAIEPGSRCVLILADGGAGYLDTVYSDEWVEGELGLDAERVAELVAAGTGRRPVEA
jgi:N-(2-amino-2-carboxyethyl)-L-glutamate synthase